MDKCKNCGKPRDHHKAGDQACPLGKRHRTMGYTAFSEMQTYRRSFDKPEVGKCYLFKNKPVFITSVINNYFRFRHIKPEDGRLDRFGGCFDTKYFTEEIKCKIETRVIIDWRKWVCFDL
jgi:hypothetical protein